MCGNGNLQAPAHFLSFPNGNTRNAPDSFPLPLCKNSADKVLHTENDLLTKKKELESKIATKEEEIRTLKARLSNIVRQHEFATVQDFYTAFYTAQRAFDAYQKERSKWEEAYGEKVTPKFETEYSCAITPQVRQAGNRLSGLTETAYASLLA